jgi:uncharacterized protein
MCKFDLDGLAALVRDAPGLRGKRDLDLVAGLHAGIDGDDGAVVGTGEERIVVCGEAMAPALLEADPFRAGAAAVVTNVSDVRAMGGRPLAIVDMLVSPDREHAQLVLDGLRWASELLAVPIVGGHLTIGHHPSLAASCTGTVRVPLRGSAARPGDVVLAAFALEGGYGNESGVFFSSLRDRTPAQLRDDGEALVEVAERGLCHAARDVSMPGVAGSLLQMIEGAGCGATLDVGALPRPAFVPLERWILTFPSFGFVLAARPENVALACEAFTRRGLACAPCGTFDEGGRLLLTDGTASSLVWDFERTPLTDLRPAGSAG